MKKTTSWPQVVLHDIAHVQTGLSKSENRTGPSIKRPYLRVANVQDGHLDLSEIKEIEVPANQLERFILQNGDILLTEGGDFDKLGRGCMWRNEIPDCVHQNHIFAVRIIDTNTILPEFLALQVQSPDSRNYFLSCAKQTTNLASINSSQLKRLPILLPPLDEQRKIVDLLANWSIAIEKADRLIEAQNLLLSHLREKTLRHTANTGKVKLQAVTDESTERNRNRFGRDSIMAVTKGQGMRPMREETIAADIARYKLVRPRAFAYNPMRLNIGSITMSGFEHEVLVSPDYVVFECDESKLLPRYLDHLRLTRHWLSYFGTAGNGSVRVRIYYDDLGAFAFDLPSLDVQRRIVDVLDAAVLEIEALRRYAEALRMQKRGLMQKLLTGQWHVNAPEPKAA